jgi:hypothetical protein
MCKASTSATALGRGTVRRERGVFGTVRRFPSGLVCHSPRTFRRRKSTSWTRSASNSATRSPEPAWAITMARQRAGIASASKRSCSTVSGTIRSRSDRGRLSLVTGLEATSRSCTAALYTDLRKGDEKCSVPGGSTWARSVTQAFRRPHPGGAGGLLRLIQVQLTSNSAT